MTQHTVLFTVSSDHVRDPSEVQVLGVTIMEAGRQFRLKICQDVPVLANVFVYDGEENRYTLLL